MRGQPLRVGTSVCGLAPASLPKVKATICAFRRELCNDLVGANCGMGGQMSPLPFLGWLPDPMPGPVRHADGRLGPPVPRGRRVVLPGRGAMFVREIEGPEGAPTVVLLHGWMASGGLNWFQTFESLGREFRVLAPDLRGHARGMRASRFRLEDCADDVAALCRVLRTDAVRRRGLLDGRAGGSAACGSGILTLVGGLVLCATSDNFVSGPGRERRSATRARRLARRAHASRRGHSTSRRSRCVPSSGLGVPWTSCSGLSQNSAGTAFTCSPKQRSRWRRTNPANG